jgi:uncharacterized membrane protein
LEGIVVALIALVAVLVAPVLAVVALLRASELRRRLADAERRLMWLEVGHEAEPGAGRIAIPHGEPQPAPRPEHQPSAPARPVVTSPGLSTPVSPPRHSPRAPSRPVNREVVGGDFATQLGPRILVATGALAFMVFLGLFVRYAWENDWVGPSGRVFLGAVTGISLVAIGLRTMNHRYAPLGQGLAAAGLVGLYVSAFAAHGFYALVPRELAGALMLVITGCAVALAARLAARLFAALGWLGAYATPLLLSTGADHAEALFAYLALLNLGVLVLDHYRPWPETFPLGVMGTLVLYLGWYGRHFSEERFEVAAVGLVLLAAQFVLGAAREARPWRVGVALTLAGLGGCLLAADADRPWFLLGVLVALGALAATTRSVWRWAELAGATGAGLAILIWIGQYYHPGREREALLLVSLLAAGYSGLQLLRLGRAAGPEISTHLVAVGFLWTGLYQVLYQSDGGGWLGPISAGLGAAYLALGLYTQRSHPTSPRHAQVLLGIAAGLVTLAIPVQLGLHGITLGWMVEGAVLLGLGCRLASRRTRSAGYAVLAVAVGRLVIWHLPLHSGGFRPVFNPQFGTWLFVVTILGVSLWLARDARARGDMPDRPLGPVLAGLALLLMFTLLTMETGGAFEWQARAARAAGDTAAAQAARFGGSLAVSALWATFATGLLGAGLGLRNRPLFFASYALFALTGAKLILFDLSTLHALYRMLSFLVVALLLLVGAYLNLRFRERLIRSDVAL